MSLHPRHVVAGSSGPWIPLLLGVAGVVAAQLLAGRVRTQEVDAVRDVTRSTVALVGDELRTRLDVEIFGLEHVASRWKSENGLTSDAFEAEARLLLTNLGHSQAIEWVDSEFRALWIVPLEGNDSALGMDVGFETRRRAALEAARDRREVTITRPLDLVQGGKGFLVVAPVHADDAARTFQGFVVGTYRLRPTMDALLRNVASGFAVSIEDGPEEVYSSPSPVDVRDALAASTTIEVRDRSWTVRVAPGPGVLASYTTALPATVALSGTLGAVLLALTVYFARRAQSRATKLESAYEQLQSLEALQRGRSAVLEKIALTEAPIEEVLSTVARAVESILPDVQCSILLYDAEAGRLHLAAAPSLPDFYNEAVNGIEVGPTVGSCGAAAATGRRVIVADVLEHPNWSAYRELAMKADFRACWSEPILSSTGSVLGTFAMYYRDPREPGELELGFIETSARLVQLAIERERMRGEHDELEERLRASQKMQALGTLAGGVAHDFNNILLAILGHAELVKEELDPASEARRDIEQIEAAVARATSLVQQVLAFSRRARPALQVVDLAEVVREALALLHVTLPPNIELRQELGPSPCLIRADSSQVHQVVLNLCANAAHALGLGGGVLEVSLELPHQPLHHLRGPVARLVVRDSGTGMDATTLERAFEPFFTTKAVGEGTGLGLAVVHGIVENHAASIEIESDPGEGTTVRIDFELVTGDATVITPSLPAVTAHADARPAANRRT